MSQADYAKDKGKHCPFCGSDTLQMFGRPQNGADEDVIFADVDCTSCGKAWVERYRLEGFDAVE